MIKFDPSSIYNRIVEKLQQDPNWKAIVNNSVISALIKSNAEINAETARYAEYLFKESKWDTAQNSSSILAMANILGYKPRRKISARGTIYVSADPSIHLVGKQISEDTFRNHLGDLTNWGTLPDSVNITSDCIIKDSHDNSYVPSPILFNGSTRSLEVNIIQGKKKRVTIDIATIRATATTSKLDPYLYIPVKIYNCENADTAASKPFLRIWVDSQEYRIVDSLLLSSESDYDVEFYNDLYNLDLFYLKFNNDPLRGNVLDISESNSSIKNITIEYIESNGFEGNLLNLYENFTLTNLKLNGKTDDIKLYGVNLNPIKFGRNEENASDIKTNAPLYYIRGYTAGTKEAYTQAIKNMEFTLANGAPVRPNKVQVYGAKEVDANGNSVPVTCISFIAGGLEDLVSQIEHKDDNPYSSIEESLNYYLYRLKSPQDTLKFIPPKFVTYALGVDCTVDRDKVDDINQLEKDIRDFIDTQYGSNSDQNDFGRNIYPTKIEVDIKNAFPDQVIAPVVEIEAVQKLNWFESTREDPKALEMGDAENKVHTIRIPFEFNPVFKGKLQPPGFKDYQVSAGYVMRIDFLYKKPKAISQNLNFNTSIFIQDGADHRKFYPKDATGAIDTTKKVPENPRAFYLCKDSGTGDIASIWPSNFAKASSKYSYLNDIYSLDTSQQYYFKDKLITDNEYRNMLIQNTKGDNLTISSYKTSPGAIDDYLIYFSANYDTKEGFGEGWLELSFAPIYTILQIFAQYDNTAEGLRSKLAKCPLPNLQCGNDLSDDMWKTFQEILHKYVEVYVCMRPYDPQLVVGIEDTERENASSVLYVDSFDSDKISDLVNLSLYKKPRMISVNCKYEGNN